MILSECNSICRVVKLGRVPDAPPEFDARVVLWHLKVHLPGTCVFMSTALGIWSSV